MTRILEKTFPNRSDITKDNLMKAAVEILEKLERDIDPNDTKVRLMRNLSLLDDLENSFLYLYLQLCNAKQERLHDLPTSRREVPDESLASLPCEVFFSEKYKALLIDTPVNLGSNRNYANKMQEHILKTLVATAVEKFKEDNDFDLAFSIKKPFSFCLYRRCLEKQSSSVVPDIDNIDSRNIINTIVSELSLDDSYSSLICNVNSIEYVGCKEERGTSILIVEESKRNALEKEFKEEYPKSCSKCSAKLTNCTEKKYKMTARTKNAGQDLSYPAF